MQSILNFFIKHNHWFLFLLLEGISLVLIVSFNNYQGAAAFTSANSIAGNIYSAFTDIEDYFTLREKNVALVSHNKALLEEIESLRNELGTYKDSALLANAPRPVNGGEYYYNTARVVNINNDKNNYFITIDKGSDDGIKQQMGVFNERGVIGITYTSSDGFTIVLPLLNGKNSLSCKIKDTNSYSTLKWDGDDTRYSYLIDLPNQAGFGIGDTVVTSGFSSIFPEGMPVGAIENIEDSNDGLFFKAKVKLFVDFSSIGNVYVVGNDSREEQEMLENSLKEE